MKKYLILGSIIGIILILFGIYYYKNIYIKSISKENINQPPNIIALDESPIIEKSLPILMEFSSNSCPACIKIKPIIEQLKSEYNGKVKVNQIDVYENPKESDKYNITLIPTLIFFDSSAKQIFRNEGFMTKEQIITKFKEMGIQ